MTQEQFDRYAEAAKSHPNYVWTESFQIPAGYFHVRQSQSITSIAFRFKDDNPNQYPVAYKILGWHTTYEAVTYRLSGGQTHEERGWDAILKWEQETGISISDLDVLLL